MKKYKPVDAIYEDIYDFDDINGKSFETPRSRKTFSINEYGDIVRPTHKPRVPDDDRVHLPPVVVGKNLVPRPPTARRNTDHRHEKTSVELGHRDIDYLQRRKTPHVPRQQHKEHGGNLDGSAHLASYTKQGYRPSRPEPADDDVLYRSLMEGVHDKSMLEKSPQVLEYERRNNIRHEGCKSLRQIKPNEETVKKLPLVQNDPLRLASKHSQGSVYQPAPPTAPKPEAAQQGYNRNRRRVMHANTQLDQDVSIHNPSKLYLKPRPPTAEVEIDFNGGVQEALRIERELDLLHKELEKQKKTNMPYGMDVLPPTTAAAANSNLPGRSTPCLIPTGAVPYKSAEHVKTWNGDSAKRGLGFRSKIKREQQEKRKLDISFIPDKIRKEMKKYFG